MSRPTPSFVTEIALNVDPEQERVLLARRFEARQVYNACLGESLKRREHVMHDKRFAAACQMKRGQARTGRFAEIDRSTGFREYDLHRYAKQFGKCWIGRHLDSLTVQKLASRAFDAVQKYHFHQRGRPRFKGPNQIDSVEGKNNQAGILWREDATTGQAYVTWLNLRLEPRLDRTDAVLQHGLAAPVKYVRLVRRKLSGHNRFSVQLVCQGFPYQKPEHPVERGVVGLDIGPSTLAIVTPLKARLLLFCAQLARRDQVVRRLQRQRDRQQRANNLGNYDPDGTIRSGKKTWKKSRRQAHTERKLAELQRQQAAYRRSLHGQLVNLILAQGNDIRMEKLSYRAFQKRFGRSVAFRAPGTFVSHLKRKAANAGATVTEFSTYHTKLSQTCHQCGKVEPKPLSQRWHRCACGLTAQRDLYSAFLATCVDNNRLNADQAQQAWSGVDTLLRAALSDAQAQLASGGCWPASFGLNRSQSQSPGKAGSKGQTANTPGAVGEQATASVDAVRKAVHPPEPPPFGVGSSQDSMNAVSGDCRGEG